MSIPMERLKARRRKALGGIGVAIAVGIGVGLIPLEYIPWQVVVAVATAALAAVICFAVVAARASGDIYAIRRAAAIREHLAEDERG